MPNTRALVVVVFCALLALTGTGCATKYKQIAVEASAPQWLRLLEDGRTTESALRAQLGEPSGSFESGRVLTYRLGKKYKVASDWVGTRYSLVLVFDENEILSRHSLLRVKS